MLRHLRSAGYHSISQIRKNKANQNNHWLSIDKQQQFAVSLKGSSLESERTREM
jgi:hypothetical protein